MNAQRVARRYAAALFEVATKAGSADQAGRDLSDLGRLVNDHAELRHVVASPTVPASAKKAVFVAIMDAAGITSGEVRRLVDMLADRDRLLLLPHVADAFIDRLNDAKRIAQADVVTAIPLTAASRAALAEALGRASGKVVTMTERVDPAIIGGVVARIGSFIYDASVAGQLGRLKERLATNN
jgi:F-type H+-transporting ATPase subunit delta